MALGQSGTRFTTLRTPMGPRVWIVIPTYNEAENLEAIIEATSTVLDTARPGGYRILVVDDNSPDGTGRLADELAERLSTVEVLHRPGKAGLGAAYRAGFAHGLDAGAELLVEMDADFSHDPAYLPALLSAAEDADLVLGSRYVPGGGVRDWGLVRKVISQGGGMYARRILRIAIRDPTGGFKCIRREVLQAIEIDTVRADGYVFQIEVTYRALLAGFRVREVPIVFRDRRRGTSKMSARIALEAMRAVPAMRRSAPAAVARGAQQREAITPS
jgi:dolichol-phosphate mannosyltransferase